MSLGKIEDSTFVQEATFALLALTILLVSLRRLKKHLEAKIPFDGAVPMPPHSHWFFGHVQTFQKIFTTNRTSVITDYADELGRVGFWIGPNPVLMVTHAEDARALLQAEYYRNLPFFVRKHSQRFLGLQNIGVLQGKEWKRHRSAIYKSVSPLHVLRSAEWPMQSVAEDLVLSIRERLRSSTSDFICLDIEDVMKMVTIDVFAKTTLSTDLECCKTLTRSPIAVAFGELLEDMNERLSNITNPMKYFYFLPNAQNKRHEKNRRLLRNFLKDLVEERRQEMNSGIDTRADVLTNLLKAHQDTTCKDGDVSDSALHDTLMALLFAGFDTTSVTLTFAFYLLSQHPQVEKNCISEIKNILEHEDKTNLASRLVYCGAVINETLRLFPPAGATSRVLQKPVKLTRKNAQDFEIPANTRILVAIDAIQRNERHFQDPDDFLPTRWVRQTVADPSNSHVAHVGSPWEERGVVNRDAFLAFSAGGRSCPGQRFAMQEATLVLAMLLENFKMEPIPGYILETTRTAVIQRPKGGMPMRISLRKE